MCLVGSREMARRQHAQGCDKAEHRDYSGQAWREALRKEKQEHEEWVRHTRDTYLKINRPALVELFNKDWSRSDVGYPEWFEKLAKVLASPKRSQEFKDRLRYLVFNIFDRVPGLIAREYFVCLILIASEDWVRPLDNWKPGGKSRYSHYKSLIDHLFVKYPVPKLFYLLAGTHHRGWNGMAFFVRVARGEKVAKCFDGSILKHPRIPMTKRMCHHLMLLDEEADFICGVRNAQAMALGGGKELARALGWTFLGRGILKDEDFWLTVTRWFCEQPAFDHSQIGPILDYIKNRHEADIGFSMKGRTVRSLTRDIEEWHRQLAMAEKLTRFNFKASGFNAGTWELEGQHGGKRQKFVWTINELMTSKDLHAEGKTMRHCVYSYAEDIQKGTSSIWSLRRNGARILTVEVWKGGKKVVQARGKCNRSPKKYELNVLGRWAQENGLVLDVNRFW